MQQRQNSSQRPHVAFVLTGGAALGASQVGMLRALLERGIRPDLIVGTSIGAWNGLWLAAHPDLASLDALEGIWRSITLMEVLGKNMVNLITNVATRRPYLVSSDGMRRIFQRASVEGNLLDVTFEELAIPFKVTATNIMQGRSEVFEQGLVAPAILASSAIPGMFPPVMIDGQQYVDGGLLDNGGVSVAVEAGARTIYVLSAMYGGPKQQPITTLPDLLLRDSHLISAHQVYDALHRYANRAEFIMIEDEAAGRVSTLDFRHTADLFISGYQAAEKTLGRHEGMPAPYRLVSNSAHETKSSGAWVQSPPVHALLYAAAHIEVALRKEVQKFAPRTNWRHRPVTLPPATAPLEKKLA